LRVGSFTELIGLLARPSVTGHGTTLSTSEAAATHTLMHDERFYWQSVLACSGRQLGDTALVLVAK
jgi:hypothetical protein